MTKGSSLTTLAELAQKQESTPRAGAGAGLGWRSQKLFRILQPRRRRPRPQRNSYRYLPLTGASSTVIGVPHVRLAFTIAGGIFRKCSDRSTGCASGCLRLPVDEKIDPLARRRISTAKVRLNHLGSGGAQLRQHLWRRWPKVGVRGFILWNVANWQQILYHARNFNACWPSDTRSPANTGGATGARIPDGQNCQMAARDVVWECRYYPAFGRRWQGGS
jgi:hypothetical protein